MTILRSLSDLTSSAMRAKKDRNAERSGSGLVEIPAGLFSHTPPYSNLQALQGAVRRRPRVAWLNVLQVHKDRLVASTAHERPIAGPNNDRNRRRRAIKRGLVSQELINARAENGDKKMSRVRKESRPRDAIPEKCDGPQYSVGARSRRVGLEMSQPALGPPRMMPLSSRKNL